MKELASLELNLWVLRKALRRVVMKKHRPRDLSLVDALFSPPGQVLVVERPRPRLQRRLNHLRFAS
jgi:hypothetical protein